MGALVLFAVYCSPFRLNLYHMQYVVRTLIHLEFEDVVESKHFFPVRHLQTVVVDAAMGERTQFNA